MTPPMPSRDRREFLWQLGGGLGGIALAHLLGRERLLAGRRRRARPELNGGLHHRAKVKRVIQLFMNGGVSQMDTFDYKPELDQAPRPDVRPRRRSVEAATSTPGNVMKSPFAFKQHGQCGRWVSSVFPHLASCVDDLAFLMAMASQDERPRPGQLHENTGFLLPGFPCMGAWISLRPGQPQRQPADVRRPARPAGPALQRQGQLLVRLPARRPPGHDHQRRRARRRSPTCSRPSRPSTSRPRARRDGLELLGQLNREPRRARPGRLAARGPDRVVRAGRPDAAQRPEVLDLSGEIRRDAQALRPRRPGHRRLRPPLPDRPPAARARRALRAGLERRRRGRRNNWDNHTDIPTELPADRPAGRPARSPACSTT